MIRWVKVKVFQEEFFRRQNEVSRNSKTHRFFNSQALIGCNKVLAFENETFNLHKNKKNEILSIKKILFRLKRQNRYYKK